MAKHPVDPLPTHTAAEITASQAEPLPPGVTMVRMNKRVTGLHVDPGVGGISVLERPDRPWRPLPTLTKVSRGAIIRSRLKLRFADGTSVTVRPYKPKFKGLLETGRPDSINVPSTASGDGRNDSSLDGLVGIFVVLAAIVLFPVSLVMLAREIFGTSARAKQAALLLPQLRAVIRPS